MKRQVLQIYDISIYETKKQIQHSLFQVKMSPKLPKVNIYPINQSNCSHFVL